MNKIINHENSSDLIQLVERRKSQENTKNNSNIKIVKLKFKKKEDIKTSNKNEFNNENIVTILRIRPQNLREKKYSNIKVIKIDSSSNMRLISPIEYNYFLEGTKFINVDRGLEVTKTEQYYYQFDQIFDYYSQQSQVYEYSAKYLVKNIFEGFNSTIFAYGSIGSGKSYTMFGTNDKHGIIIRVINQILNIMNNKGLNTNYDLQISFYKIYNEAIIDLLSDDKGNKAGDNNQMIINQEENKNKFNSKNNNGNSNKSFFMEITKKIISTPEEVYQILTSSIKDKKKTIVGKNNSSRAHYIVEINIVNKQSQNPEKNRQSNFGKFILADLAGFEKVTKIKPNTDNFYINKSLFALSNCINGLINHHNRNYIPWRDSKLTMILKDHLSGNAKIVMIANISPSLLAIEETFNTLNFAKKIQQVKTNAQKNVETQPIHIDKFDSIITSLKDQIINVKKEINKNEVCNNSMFSLYGKKRDEIEEDEETKGNAYLQKFIEEIKSHFNKEIELCKEINNIEFNISAINKQNYFNQVNNKTNRSTIKKEVSKLNDYQLSLNSLYTKRHHYIQKRKNLQSMITKESKKDTNLGKYLMYVYRYYINLINQLQHKNRQNKLDVDTIRKDDQISNLSKQIKIRDVFLQDMREKIGNQNNSFNYGRIKNLEEITMDPCLDTKAIKREDSLNDFVNSVMLSSDKKMSRNISMPSLKKGNQIFKDFIKNNRTNNKILPRLKKFIFINSFKKKNDSSIFKKRIPSGFILKNRGAGNNFRYNLWDQCQKYYNIYHVSNNYHVGNFKAGNPDYLKNKNKNRNMSNSGTHSRHISKNFANYYENKVKTILNKNYFSRYNNSPYSLENI